jgi:hypothetical protein
MTDLREKNARSDKDLFSTFAPMYMTILCALLVLSCGAANSAQEITVQVPDRFTGTLQIDTCNVAASSDHVTVDAHGAAMTPACPTRGQQVTLVIAGGGQTYRIVPDKVTVVRTGDGLPVRIQATLPPR